MLKNKWQLLAKLLPLGLKLEITKNLIEDNSSALWPLYEKINIPGFGIQLARFLFPIYRNFNGRPSVNPSFGETTSEIISDFFSKNRDYYAHLFPGIVNWQGKLLQLPLEETNEELPYLNNEFYTLLEASVLGEILTKYQPKTVYEIGSGISTRFFRQIINEAGLSCKLISIDPEPSKSIEKVSDEIILLPLEEVIQELKTLVSQGDMIFLDGSHYVFPNNDTTSFFLDLLPSLPSGVIIHIHDIYLPYDYPLSGKKHLWGEQYLLASMIIGGFNKFELLFPTAYILSTEPDFCDLMQPPKELSQKGIKPSGSSFWMLRK